MKPEGNRDLEIGTLDRIKSHYTEWQYRHAFYWRAFYRWWLVVVIVESVPYARPEILSMLGLAVLFFPIAAILLIAMAYWHLNEEEKRLVAAHQQVRRIRDHTSDYEPPKIGGYVGRTLVIFTSLGFTALSILSMVMLFHLTNK
jgi:hypothetical protein